MKYTKFFISCLALLSVPLISSANIAAGWNATSTSKGYISPTRINSNDPWVQADHYLATSTTATSIFSGPLTVNATASANKFMINTSQLNGIKGGFIPDAPTLPITDFGLNAAQFGTWDTTTAGGIFRFDLRAGHPFFSILYQPTGSGGVGSQTFPIQVTNDANNSLLVGTGWGPDNNSGTGNGEALQVSGNTYVSGTANVVSNLSVGGSIQNNQILNIVQCVHADATGVFGGTGSDCGTVTSIGTNHGLTGGTVTGSGTFGLDLTNIKNNTLLYYNGTQLQSSTTPTGGWFVATSTSKASVFPYASTTMITATTASTTNLIISGITGTTCLQAIAGVVSGTGSACGAGGGGAAADWKQELNTYGVNSLTPTSTIPVEIKSTSSSTFAGGLESFTSIGTPYFAATSTTATSTYAGDITVGSGSVGFVADYTGNGGIGTSTPYASFSIQSGASTGDAFAVATTTNTLIGGYDNDGHRFTSGYTPTLSSCGTGSPTVTGDDQTGTITTGTAATSCTMTFVKVYRKTPVCNFNDDSSTIPGDISSISTSAVTFALGAGLSGGHLYYQCSYHR